MSELPADAGRTVPIPMHGEAALRVVPDLLSAPGAGLLEEEQPFDQELVCRRVVRVTHDVATFVLAPTRPGTFSFSPGQYLTLTLEIHGRTVERCYTISSPPTRPHLLTLTVKRMPGGEVSGWLHDHLRPGGRVAARGPMGSFSVAEHPAARYLLLSAGSGITPTLSTVRTLVDLAERSHVAVVHSARTPADLICRAELEALAATGGPRVHWVCESDPRDEQVGPVGRISAELLARLVPDIRDREVFSCGPAGYLAAVRSIIAELGLDPRRCHEESFVLAEAEAAGSGTQPAVADRAPSEATVRFARSGVEVRCPAGTTVLDAARDAGVLLPSSCTQGMCGTCKSTLLAGHVDMNHAGGIRPREIAQDKFLPCCSTPQGDIVVDA